MQDKVNILNEMSIFQIYRHFKNYLATFYIFF